MPSFKSISILVIVLLCAVTVFLLSSNKTTVSELWGYPVTLQFTHQNIAQYTKQTRSFRLQVSRIHNIDKDEATQLTREKIFQFSSLFEKQRAGYVGQQTDFIECDDKFRPVLEEKTLDSAELLYFSGYANERYVPGECDEQQIRYSYINFLLYCKNKNTFLDGELFVETKNTDRIPALLSNMNCHFDLPSK